MKGIYFFIAILFSLAVELGADNSRDKGKSKDLLFDALKFSYCAGVLADGAITHYAIDSGIAKEGNPLASLYIEKQSLSLAINLGVMIFTNYILDELHRKNKLIAYVIVIGAVLFKGYLVYHNWKMIE